MLSDAHKIGLFLADKHPYLNSDIDKLEFIELIKYDFNYFNEDSLTFINNQSERLEDFYTYCLNKIKRKNLNDYQHFIDKLKIPQELITPIYIGSKIIGFITPFKTLDERKAIFNKALPKKWLLQESQIDTINYLWEEVKIFLQSYDIYIADLRDDDNSNKAINENVLIECGYVLAKGKILIPIVKKGKGLPSDLEGLMVVIDDLGDSTGKDDFAKREDKLVSNLQSKINDAIKSVGQ